MRLLRCIAGGMVRRSGISHIGVLLEYLTTMRMRLGFLSKRPLFTIGFPFSSAVAVDDVRNTHVSIETVASRFQEAPAELFLKRWWVGLPAAVPEVL